MKAKNLFIAGLILIVLLGSIPVQAQVKEQPLEQEQEVLQYRSKAEFNQDTVQYLEYNFVKRGTQYEGKKVSDVLKDLDLPVLYISESTWSSGGGNPSRLKNLSLVVRQVGDEPNVFEDYYIAIYFAEPPLMDDYQEASGFGMNNSYPVLTPKLYNFLKDKVVLSVYSNPFIIYRRENKKGEFNEDNQ